MRTALLLLALAASADDKKPEATAEVKAKIVVPGALESFMGRTLEVQLFQYDPRAADLPADLVDRYELKPFAHGKGADTVKEFALGGKHKLDGAKGYYLTLFVLDGKARTHIGACDHAGAFAKVLTGGAPNQVRATFREVKR
ncbi:MAG: hypothetical protein ACRC33_03505 [Gemmataceae bacterium]